MKFCIAATALVAALAGAQPQWTVAWQGNSTHRYPDHTVTHAAEELAAYLRKVLVQPVTVAPWAEAAGDRILYLTDAATAPPEIAARFDGKPKDAFLIKYPCVIDGKTVCLLAAHDNVAHDFSAYYFLTRFLDVHWVGPGELGEVYTPQPDWQLPAEIDVFEEPAFDHRFWHMTSFSGRQWLGRSGRMQFHHALGTIFAPAKFAESDPEVYPTMADGSRYIPDYDKDANASSSSGWQPCVSSPRAVEIAAAYVLDLLEKNPDLSAASLSINDGAGNYCLCENCKALDAPDAYAPGRRPKHSDRYFSFYNRVIEKVVVVKPDAYVCVMSYGTIGEPPTKVKIHPHIQLFIVVPNMERICLWARAGAPINIYQWLWDGGFLSIRPDMRLCEEQIKIAHRLGGRGFYAENIAFWPACGHRFYALSHLLWDPSQTVDDLYRRFFTKAYGAGASQVMRYYARWEEIFGREPRSTQYNAGTHWRQFSQFDHFRRSDFEFMADALAAAAASDLIPAERQRLAYIQTYHQWLAINAEQVFLGRELADPAWVAALSFDTLLARIRDGLQLTDRFRTMWQEQLLADETGWLIDQNVRRQGERAWDLFIGQLRMLVASRLESAVDEALANVVDQRLATDGKDRTMAFLKSTMAGNPDLEACLGTQLRRLQGEPQTNLVVNGDFETASEDPDRRLHGWLTYQEYGMMKKTINVYRDEPGTGHDGGTALGMGDGDYAELRCGVPLEAGHRYRISYWYKTDGIEKREISFWLFKYTGDPADLINVTKDGISRFLRFQHQPTAGAWQTFSQTFTVPVTATYLLQPAAGRQKPGEWLWIDDVEIVQLY